MADRRLVVTDADSTSADYGKMFALAPGNATGVAIPAFKIGTSRPAVGTTTGEGFYDSTTRQGYVWDGATWKDIAANPILQFATDTDLVRDTTSPVGSYAISASTGNLYVKRTAGWSRVGVALYPTVTDLLNDNPTVGTLGEALDEGSLWERASGGWRVTGPRELANTAAVLDWGAKAEVHTFTVTTPAAAVGTEVVGATFDGTAVTVTATAAATPAAVAAALAAALLAGLPATFKVDYTPGQTTIVVRGPATGAPVVVTALQNVTDAVTAGNSAAAVGANVGDTAVALDVDVLYMRTSSGWRPVTIWEDTEANIRAATWAMNGQEAIATDTGRTFARIQGTWIEEPIQHYTTEALLLAATPPNGTLAWSDDTQVVFTRAGGTWHRMGSPTMTYGTTAPATAATGDLWYNSAGNRQTLSIWNGTAWISTTGVTHGATGARVIIPGYFAEDPSATATADDIGGLAFRYYGGQTQLWLNKDAAWHPVTPMLGVASSVDKPVVADANGNLQFSRYLRTHHALNNSSSVASIDFKGNGNRAMANASFVVEGHIQSADQSSNATIAPYIRWADDSEQDFASTSSGIVSVHNTTQWKSGGEADSGNTFITNHGCRFTFKNIAAYAAKYRGATYFRLSGVRSGNSWLLSWEGSYLSSNDTPLIFGGGCQIDRASDIRAAGAQMYHFGDDRAVLAAGALTGEWTGPA